MVVGKKEALDSQEVVLIKQKMRRTILSILKTQKEAKRKRKSSLIKEKLFRSSLFRKAKRIMFYISLKGEVGTDLMIHEAQKQGKIIAVPVCARKSSCLHASLLHVGAALAAGPYGVREPVEKLRVSLEDLDLVIVPGIAFDKKRNRLGRGKGFYDRMLARLPEDTPTIGLAFDFQILPSVPTTARDMAVHKVLFA